MSGRSVHSRVLNVFAAVDAVRAAHPALAAPATPQIVWRALHDEGIRVRRRIINARGRVTVFDGEAIITLRKSLSPREAWKWALHEYGHARMHFQYSREHVRQLSPCCGDDPREDEATLFALLLFLGPDATPETPEVAAYVGRMTAREILARRPTQIEIELPPSVPLPAPAFRPLPAPYDDERAYEIRLAKSAAAKAKIFRDGPRSQDFDRIDFFDQARRATRFTDLAGHLWWIYNYRMLTDEGRPRWVRVRDHMSRAIDVRLFVNSVGERRAYRFANRRERRIYRASVLDRQLAEARALPRHRNESEQLSPRRQGAGS